MYYRLLFIQIFFSLQICGQNNPVILQHNATSVSVINSIAIGSDKSVLISGNCDGGLTLGSNMLSTTSAYVTKYDSLGQNLWLLRAGKFLYTGSRDKIPKTIIDPNQDIYILGDFDDTCFVGNYVFADTGIDNSFLAKVTSSGNVAWAFKLASNSVRFNDMDIDIYGNLFLTGYLYGTLTFGSDTLVSQGYDVVILKLDSAGNYIWMRKAGGPPSNFNNSEGGNSISTDVFGNCYVAGFLRSINPVFGTITIPISSTAGFTGFIAKYDSSGLALWAKRCGYEANSVSSDPDGNIFVGGYTYSSLIYDTLLITAGPGGNGRGFVTAIDPNGSLKWAQLLYSDFSTIEDVAADNEGNCYIVGSSRDTTKICGIQDTLVLYNSFYPQPNNCAYIFGLDSVGNPFMGNLLNNSNYSISMNDVHFSHCSLAFTGGFGSNMPVYYLIDSLLPFNSTNGFAIVQNGCNTLSSIHESNQIEKEVVFFPNPFHDQLYVSNKLKGVQEFKLYDSTGRLLLSKNISGATMLNTEYLPNGLYFYKVIGIYGDTKTGKLIKN